MRISQFYQTTIMDLESNLAAGILVVPATALSDPRVLTDADAISDALGLTPRYVSDSASSLPYMIASVLTEPKVEAAEERMLELGRVASDRLWERVGPELAEFAEQIAYGRLVPFEESPLNLAPLASIANAGSKAGAAGIGFTIGLVAGYDSALVLITVPAGIILCGAAIAVATALMRGLTPRLTSLLMGKPMKRERPKTAKEKIVASVRPPHRGKPSKGKD